MKKDLVWIDLGLISYEDAFVIQEQLHEKCVAETWPDTLLFQENYPVITLGRGTHEQNLLMTPAELLDQGIALTAVSRGGDISYKQKSITNIETDLQNVLATATGLTVNSSQPTSSKVYGIGFNDQGECVEVINGVAYQTDQITALSFNVSNGNTMNYEIVPKHEMSVLEGGIVMNNFKSATLNTQLNGDDKKGFLVITLVN